jgi:hypothetical protein
MADLIRERWFSDVVDMEENDIDPEEYGETPRERHKAVGDDPWNLISSKVDGSDLHMPALDIDFDARLLPSRTEDHWHLYLDRPMKWWRYRLMLWALKIAGVIEPGYYRASVQRKMTFLRRPDSAYGPRISYWALNRLGVDEADTTAIIGQWMKLLTREDLMEYRPDLVVGDFS